MLKRKKKNTDQIKLLLGNKQHQHKNYNGLNKIISNH